MDLIDVYKATIRFKESPVFKWSPFLDTVFFNPKSVDSTDGRLSLLHEIAHAHLKHTAFDYDLDLLECETQAWKETKTLARLHDTSFDEDYAQNCLETYRVWLYERSKCPQCHQTSLELKPQIYQCFNCAQKWSVSKDQTCQIQRKRL